MGLGFLVLVPAAQLAAGWRAGQPDVADRWSTSIHTLAELCLSPVGLSSMTKLAPRAIVGLMMGVWFLGASVGNYIAGQMASFYEQMPLAAPVLRGQRPADRRRHHHAAALARFTA